MQQAENARLVPPSPRTESQLIAADQTSPQGYSSPRRKARGSPRHLSERQRQRRVCHHQHKQSPEPSTDDALVGEVARTPRNRRREPRSKIPVLERSRTFSTAAETANSAVTAVARPRTSDDSGLVVLLWTVFRGLRDQPPTIRDQPPAMVT